MIKKRKKRKSSKFGIAKFLVVTLLLGSALLYGVNLVSQNQESRSKASVINVAEEYIEGTKDICRGIGGKCGDFDKSLEVGSLCRVDSIEGVIYADLCDGDTTVKCCAPIEK